MPANGDWATVGWTVGSRVPSAEFKKGVGCIFDSKLLADTVTIPIPASGSILQTYGALRIVLHARSKVAAASDTIAVRFNGDSGNNYYSQYLRAAATTVSGAETGAVNLAHVGLVPGNTATGGHKGSYEIIIPNYANTADKKCGTSRGGCFTSSASGALTTEHRTFIWDDSGVGITSITVLLTSGADIATGSRCSVYVMGV